jgi:hypothetical protein
MAPLPTLLEAAKARAAELETADKEKKEGMQELDKEIAAKREERSIAAQEAISALLKKKEIYMRESKTVAGAKSIVGKAIAKLQRAVDLGLDDWTQVHIEQVKISAFARKKLVDPEELKALRGACGGSDLTLEDDGLEYSGSKENLGKLQEALLALESNYETWIECSDQATLRLFDSRGEIQSLAKRHTVDIQQDGNWIGISGPPAAADKAASMLQAMFEGVKDIDCPTKLVGAMKPKAKEVEIATGAIVDVQRQGGWNGGGVIYVRGMESCVLEACTQLQAWLDEREGVTTELVDFAEDSALWTAPLFEQFKGDTHMMAQKFSIAVKETQKAGELELRGPTQALEVAKKELLTMIAWYKEEQAKADAQIAAEASPEPEDDGWGDAPIAEPVVGAW